VDAFLYAFADIDAVMKAAIEIVSDESTVPTPQHIDWRRLARKTPKGTSFAATCLRLAPKM